jgi:hypothetical protein
MSLLLVSEFVLCRTSSRRLVDVRSNFPDLHMTDEQREHATSSTTRLMMLAVPCEKAGIHVELVRGSQGRRIRCSCINPRYMPYELDLIDPVRIVGRVPHNHAVPVKRCWP